MVQCYRWTHKWGGNCALSVLHKTCQWANGKQGTGQVPVQINLHSLSQPATHERRATEHHPHVEKLGCCMLSTAYKDRQPGRQRRTSWEGSEREEENISVFIWWDNSIGFSTWISLITKLFRALSANWKNFYNDL